MVILDESTVAIDQIADDKDGQYFKLWNAQAKYYLKKRNLLADEENFAKVEMC